MIPKGIRKAIAKTTAAPDMLKGYVYKTFNLYETEIFIENKQKFGLIHPTFSLSLGSSPFNVEKFENEHFVENNGGLLQQQKQHHGTNPQDNGGYLQQSFLRVWFVFAKFRNQV